MSRRRVFTFLAIGLAAAAAIALLLRRGRREAAAVAPIPEVVRMGGVGRPVIFVGLDGADWELLDRYTASGAMPNLAALVREGASGTLLGTHPLLSPLVWTTIMTGRSPLEHGILDFTRFHPATGREEPITSDERRVPAVWNMATYGGRRVAVIGLWATYPAEAVNGLLVSDRVMPFLFQQDGAGPGLVHPASLLPWVRQTRSKAETAVGFAQMREYLPWLEEAEYRERTSGSDPYAHPVGALRRILVETRLHHELALEWIRQESPALAIVYFEGTDSVGHVFAPYAPPRQPLMPEADYERYHRVPEKYFRLVDGLLGEYRRLAEASGAVLMIASDHGFRWGEGRPSRVSSFAHSTAAEWHRREGVYLLWGEGISPAPGHPHRGTAAQVTPTLLALLGLPRSGDGTTLAGAPGGGAAAADYAAYYRPAEPVTAGAGGTRADGEALEKLRALGYIGAGAGGGARPAGSTRTAGSFANESLILRLQGRRAEAIGAAEKALALQAEHTSALWCLSDLLQADPAQRDRSDRLLVRAAALGLPGGSRYLGARALAYARAGEPARGVRLLAAAVEARPRDPAFRRLRGRFSVDRGECAAARADLEAAVDLAPEDPSSHAALGLARLCLGDEAGGRASLARGGASEGEAHRILAASAFARGDLARAEREARRATGDVDTELAAAVVLAQVELRRSRPEGALAVLDTAKARGRPVINLEFLRGDAFGRLGRAIEAETAFREEIRQFPQNTAAYARLALVLSLRGRGRSEIRQLLESMYEASPRRDTALLAARTLSSLGDSQAVVRWQERALRSVGESVWP